MAVRYTALRPDRNAHDTEAEMEAAFDYSEDEDEDNEPSESHPLNPVPTPQLTSGIYDFERVDYDYPPPGSPPRPSEVALPNDHGNSNGFIPSFSFDSAPGPKHNWLRRTAAAILPSSFAERLGLARHRPMGAVGGGTYNDGVFANVTAKPTRPITIQDGDDTYIVPEDSRPEAPPSYASAQADAVPPYWETTVHAPFAPGTVGEMIVDSLPTGSLFSFLWNMLVSISFQFVGFLLTYLLHTTHAARLGSRAGLGVTLIQYGFALRGRLDDPSGSKGDSAGWNRSWSPAPIPSTSGDSPYYGHHHSAPNATITEEQANTLVADATTEWLSFFLMTVGWFILLTSLLGFWRVKRWERGILASQQDHSNTPANTQSSRGALLSRLEHTFSLRGTSRVDLFRQGFGFGPRRNPNSEEPQSALLARAEEGDVREGDREALETDRMIPVDPNDPERSRRIAEALANERRLQADLRSAGLL